MIQLNTLYGLEFPEVQQGTGDQQKIADPRQERSLKDFVIACDQLDRVVLELSRVPEASPVRIIRAVEGAINEALTQFNGKPIQRLRPMGDVELPSDFSALCEEIEAEVLVILSCAQEAGITPEDLILILNGEVTEVLAPELSRRMDRMAA